MLLLIIALFGLLVPNGIFIYWLFTGFGGLGFSLPFYYWLNKRNIT